MCEALALADGPVLAALAEFGGLAHRAQWVAEIDGVRYVNDSKGTNVGATVAAVTGMPGPLVMIVGGDGKNADFVPLVAAFRGKVRHVVLIGRDATRIAAALDGEAARSKVARGKESPAHPSFEFAGHGLRRARGARRGPAGGHSAAVARVRKPRHVP